MMNESAVRSGRLLSIVLLLQGRGAMTARALGAELGVSLRTVYRDVEVLASIGVPVYSETGRAGGYRLVDGYRTSLTGLTAEESLALFLIGLPAPAASLGLTGPADAAEAKLLAALSPAHREQAGRLRERFLLDLPAWYQDGTPPPALPQLARAVLDDRRVRVRYRRWEEPREVRRLLDPYALVVKNGIWYLVAAHGRAAPRTYRVSNVLELQVTTDRFERRAGFDLARHWREHLDEFDRRRVTGTARIRVSPALVARLEDVGTATLRAAVAAGRSDGRGWTVADYPVESPAWTATQLVGYGGDLEVIEPEPVRAAVRELARAVLARHRRRRPVGPPH